MSSPLDNIKPGKAAQPEAQTSAGAELPRIVIRGETINIPNQDYGKHNDGEDISITRGYGGKAKILFTPIPDKTKPENIAHIDWLAFTFKGNGSSEEHLSFQETLNNLFNIPPLVWKGTNSGWSGYKNRVNLGCFGLLAYGGTSQKNTTHIEINAHGCALVEDWDKVYEWGQSTGSVITRCDLAYDDFQGKSVNMEICQKWYSEGLFNSNGRPPKPFLYDDCNTGDGKTFKIGKRKNGKLVRMYEKGKEQGDPKDPWFRIELELRNKDRKIPWDILVKPGQYLSGAYKAFNFLCEEQLKVNTTKKQKDMTYDQMVQWVRTCAGKALNVIIQENDGDLSAVFEQIVRDGVPKCLEPYYK